MGLFSKKTKNDVQYTAELLRAFLKNDPITVTEALSLPAVASCVDRIANTVAMIPVKLYKETEVDGKSVVEEVKDNRVALLNKDTKSTLDGFQFKKAMVTDYLMGKGGYAYIKKRMNKFIGVYYVPEEQVAISILNESPIDRQYLIEVWGAVYQPYEYLKILRNSKNGMYGVGVGAQVSNALNTALQTMILQLNLAKTGGNKRGFLQSDRIIGGDELKTLKEAWTNLYANNDTQTIPVLNRGITFKESSATSTELQLNESKQQLNNEIAKIFHVDGDYNTFFKNAIQPILTEFETALNRDFLLEKEKNELYWAFDINDITKSSIKERYEAYKLALDSGWTTKNEVRYKENMDAIDGLDTVNMGLGSVLFNTKTGEYFVPNTNTVINPDGGKPTDDKKDA